MTKIEIQNRILKNGKQLDLDLFSWDKNTRTFSSKENNLILDFSDIDNLVFNTGSDCTFKTGSDCTFKTGSDCVIIRRDKYQIIESKENEIIKLNPYGIKGYISSKDGNKYYLNSNFEGPEYIIVDNILSEIISRKGKYIKGKKLH